MLFHRLHKRHKFGSGAPTEPSFQPQQCQDYTENLNLIVNQLAALTEKVRDQNDAKTAVQAEASRQSDRNFRWTLVLTVATIAVAVVAAGAGIEQGIIAQRSFVETRDEQRAWLRVTIKPDNLYWTNEANYFGPINYDVTMTPFFLVSNVGKVPAFSVAGSLSGAASDGNLDISKVTKDSCKNLSPDRPNETIIFPGEQPEINKSGPLKTGVRFYRPDSLNLPIRKAGFWANTNIELILYGCVIYKLSASGETHHTKFVYYVVPSVVSDSYTGRFKSGIDVPASGISLDLTASKDDAS